MAENQGFTSKDAALIVSATSTSATSAALDIGAIGALGVHSEPFELEVDVPAFSATDLPSNATLTISLQSSADAAFTAPVTEWSTTIGDGEAFAGASVRYRPTLRANQFWRLAIATAGTPASTATSKAVSLSYVC